MYVIIMYNHMPILYITTEGFVESSCFVKEYLLPRINYSQLSLKRPPFVYDKVAAYGRWSLMGKKQLQRNKPNTERLTL